MGHEAAASRCSWYLDDENFIQRATGELPRQCKVQCPLHLSAQLPGLLFYPSASVSLSMLGLLQGSLKFRIK